MLRLLSRFRRSEEGSVLPLIGLASFVLIGAMGFAIDLGRAQLVQAKLLNSADAAALAVGARLSSVNLNAEATKFVNANFPTGYAQATVTSVSATADSTNSIITVIAKATVPTTLMQLLGIKKVDVSVTSQVTRQTSGLELALVLDNTGSMVTPDPTKLPALKQAATQLMDTLYGPDNAAENLYVGVVPFTDTVNIGPSRTSWMVTNSVSSKNWGTTSWAGCVMGTRTKNRDVTDDPPTVEKFTPLYWPDDSNNNWIQTSGSKTTYKIDPNGVTQTGPNAYCPTAITTLTPAKQTVVNAIAAMKEGGATHVNYGAVWGWRLLSPRWRGLWGGDMTTYSLPLDYGTPKMAKAMILMTDGDNDYSTTVYSAYQYLKDGKLGTTDHDDADSALDDKLLSVCTSMKNAGIIVYTIGFGSGIKANSKDILTSCASQPAYFFNSPTNEDLKAAFATIGDSLSNLRVSM